MAHINVHATTRHHVLTAQRWRSACLFALQGINTARQRALLALLGIVVGVAAVVALITIGKSVEQQALAEFDSMGTQVIYVSISHGNDLVDRTAGGRPRTGNDPLQRRRQQPVLPEILAMPEVEMGSELSPVLCDQVGSRVRQANVAPEFMAVRPAMQSILGLKMAQGRFLHVLDKNALWVVLGHQIHQRLQIAGIAAQPGAALSLCGVTLYVAGVLAEAGTSESTVPLRIDDSMFISVAAAARLPQQNMTENFVLKVKADKSPVEFAHILETQFSERTGRQVQTTTSQKVIDLRRRQAATYTRFLTALSSISLFVGGLGILNIMLVAVVERRREIGIRLAVGADAVDIVLQFLMESALLALAGGAAGIVTGLVTAQGVLWLTQLPFAFSGTSVVLALTASMLIGIAAGAYPALQASRQDPVHALQAG